MNINLAIVGGNITRDPEVRYTPSGTAVVEFNVAVNRKWKDRSGEMKEEVNFINCIAWGKTAENINQYFQKGSPILIEGRIKVDQWEDPDGKKRSKTKVLIERFNFCGGKKKEEAKEGDPGWLPEEGGLDAESAS
jgi:single-strand DNA-binding protein